MQSTWKVARFSSIACVDLAVHKTFQLKCLSNCYTFISGCVLCALKHFCLAKYEPDLVVNIELSTWKHAGTFQAKYVINPENWICNLLSVPLINLIFMGWRTILYNRGFKQCIVYVSFCETVPLKGLL